MKKFHFDLIVSSVVLVAMIVVILIQIIFRLMGNPLSWTEEVARWMLVWATFAGASYAFKNGGLIRVDFFVKKLFLDSPTNQVFIVMENEAAAQLARKAEITLWEKYDDTHTMVRFVTDWATQQRDVDMLVEILEQECNPTLACVS